MFTGIITHQGRVRAISGPSRHRFEIEPGFDPREAAIGASVAHSGICLTVTEHTATGYFVDVSPETAARTTIGSWAEGDRLNIEKSLKIGDALGGHLVFGHVDGCGRVAKVDKLADGSWAYVFELPGELAPLVAVKGSISVDGISLTVTEADAGSFAVCVIPHTWEATTLKQRQVGDEVNLEVDMLARYVARQMGFRS